MVFSIEIIMDILVRSFRLIPEIPVFPIFDMVVNN